MMAMSKLKSTHDKDGDKKRKKRLKDVALKVAKNSMEVNKEFQKYARFKRNPRN